MVPLCLPQLVPQGTLISQPFPKFLWESPTSVVQFSQHRLEIPHRAAQLAGTAQQRGIPGHSMTRLRPPKHREDANRRKFAQICSNRFFERVTSSQSIHPSAANPGSVQTPHCTPSEGRNTTVLTPACIWSCQGRRLPCSPTPTQEP